MDVGSLLAQLYELGTAQNHVRVSVYPACSSSQLFTENLMLIELVFSGLSVRHLRCSITSLVDEPPTPFRRKRNALRTEKSIPQRR